MWILHAILCENETHEACNSERRKSLRVDMKQRNETEEIFLEFSTL